ncbi:hypothetical protein ABLB96_14640 [Acinetobacter sp. XH1741]
MNQHVNEDETVDPHYNSTVVPEAEYEPGEIADVIHPKAEKMGKSEHYSLKVSQSRVETSFLPPEYLESYERIQPGLGKELIGVIIEHQKFQMEVKRTEMALNERSFDESVKVNEANIREQEATRAARNREIDIKSRGQIFAFIISILILSAVVLFALLGHLL